MTKRMISRVPLLLSAVLLALPLLLSACGGGPEFSAGRLPEFLGGAGGDKPAVERREKDGDVELILHPVPVWDIVGASSPAPIEADGRKFTVRMREGGFWERPFARAGLFWHSRQENVFLPVVLLGPPAEIRRAEIRAGANRAFLRRAGDNFQFTPARRAGDPDEVSSAVFEIKPKTLRALADADTALLIVNTSRGVLQLGLDVVAGDSPDDFLRNARVLFAQFAEKMAQAGG